MYYDHFLILLALNWPWYALFLTLSVLCLVPVFRRYTLSWFDPLRYIVIFAMLANTIPPFLWVVDQMTTEMFVYFLCSETALWLGLVAFGGRRESVSGVAIEGEARFSTYFFLVCFACYVGMTLLSYAMFGIPLFMDKSRLEVYQGSGGFGILQRFNGFFSVFSIYFVFHLLHQKAHRVLCYAALGLITVFLVFGGSKSAFLMLLYAYFGYSYFYLRRAPQTNRRMFLYLGIGAFLALFILSFQIARQGGEALDTIGGMVARLIGSGDCYFYAYPNDIYQGVDIGDWFSYLFQGILGPLRLTSAEDLAPSIGVQLTWLTRPFMAGVETGPNARMPIYSYILFGWGGILFAYLGGLLTSFLLFRLPKYIPGGVIAGGFATYIYISATSFVTDFGLGVTAIFDICLNLVFSVGLLYVFTAMTCPRPVGFLSRPGK